MGVTQGGRIVDILVKFLEMTHWKMETPKSYGALHLSVMLIGFFLCFFIAYLLRHKSEKTVKVIILTIGITLAVAEVYKQLMYKFIICPDELYNWGAFPFHLCSIPMYLCLIIPFLKKGATQQTMYDFIMSYSLLSGFVAFLEPSGLLHSQVTMTAHSLLWHLVLVFLGALLAFTGLGGVAKLNFKRATVMWLVLCAAAFLINCIHWRVSGGELNMFFVGPRNSSLIICKQISEKFGWYVSTILYVPAVSVGAWIVKTAVKAIRQKTQKEKKALATV